MGLLARTAMLMTPKVVPRRTPAVSTLDICRTRAGVVPAKVPDVNPNIHAKAMVAAELPSGAGIQMASTKRDERPVVAIMTLNVPTLSPSQPGMMRPKILEQECEQLTRRRRRTRRSMHEPTGLVSLLERRDVAWERMAHLTALRMDIV